VVLHSSHWRNVKKVWKVSKVKSRNHYCSFANLMQEGRRQGGEKGLKEALGRPKKMKGQKTLAENDKTCSAFHAVNDESEAHVHCVSVPGMVAL
jgi:hypothetical protein